MVGVKLGVIDGVPVGVVLGRSVLVGVLVGVRDGVPLGVMVGV